MGRKKRNHGNMATISSDSKVSQRRSFSGSSANSRLYHPSTKKEKTANQPIITKRKHDNVRDMPPGSDSPQTKSGFTPTDVLSPSASHPNKKAKFTTSKNQKTVNSNANFRPRNKPKFTAAHVFKKPNTAYSSDASNQAKGQLTAVQVFGKSNAPVTNSSKQEWVGFTPISKSAVATVNEPSQEGKSESNQSNKEAILTNKSSPKQGNAKSNSISVDGKPHFIASPSLIKHGKVKSGLRTEKALLNEAADLFKTKVDIDVIPNMKAKVESLVTAPAKSEVLQTSISKSENVRDSHLDEFNQDQSQDNFCSTEPVLNEIADSASEGGSSDEEEEEESAIPPKVKTQRTQDAELRDIDRVPNPRTEDVDSSSNESGSNSDSDVAQPDSKGGIRLGYQCYPKIERVDKLSSESRRDDEGDRQRPRTIAEIEAGATSQSTIYSSTSDSGSESTEVEEGDELERIDKDWENADSSSNGPSVKQVSGVVSAPNLSTSLDYFVAKSKLLLANVDTDAAATFPTAFSFSKGPQRQFPLKLNAPKIATSTSNVKSTLTTSIHTKLSSNMADKASDHCLIPDNDPTSSSPTIGPFKEKFRDILMGPEFNLSSSDVDELGTKLRTNNVDVNTWSNGTGGTIDYQLTQEEDLASHLPVLPSWFSQKVRKILESSDHPEQLASRDINRLTHYRAWLERVRHRRWQSYNFANEKRIQLTSLLLQYKREGRNMDAYRQRFLQRVRWKRDSLRGCQRLKKLVEGIKLLDKTLDVIYAHADIETMKWLSIQRSAERCSGAPCL